MDINQLIRSRRSVFPGFYSEKPIEKAVLEQILENGNWAPTHKLTEPWRYKVFQGESKLKLGEFLAEWYKANTPAEKYSDLKYNKTLKKAKRSGAIIAICMQRDLQQRVPEWEELASVACSVQNMWLSCTAMGIGCYWSTPGSIHDYGSFRKLEEGERCIGLLYMGYKGKEVPDSKRGPIEDKVIWYE